MAKRTVQSFSSREEAEAHFMARNTGFLKIISPERFEMWATEMVGESIKRGTVVIRDPMLPLSARGLICDAANEAIDLVVLEVPGSKEALKVFIQMLETPAPVLFEGVLNSARNLAFSAYGNEGYETVRYETVRTCIERVVAYCILRHALEALYE